MKEKQCGCIRRQAVTKADTDTDSNIDMDVDDEGPSKSSSDKTNQAVQIAPSKPKSRTTTRPRSKTFHDHPHFRAKRRTQDVELLPSGGFALKHTCQRRNKREIEIEFILASAVSSTSTCTSHLLSICHPLVMCAAASSAIPQPLVCSTRLHFNTRPRSEPTYPSHSVTRLWWTTRVAA